MITLSGLLAGIALAAILTALVGFVERYLHLRWIRANAIRDRPKPDDRSSIALHNRIIGRDYK